MEYEDEFKHTCEGCGRRVDEDNCNHTNDYCWCDSCHNDRFSYCDQCGEYCDSDDVHDITGERRLHRICRYCAESMGALLCDDCGDYCTDYVTTDDNSNTYCEDCADRNCERCDHCSESYDDISRHNAQQHQVCPECEEVLVDSDSDCLYEHNQKCHPELIIELEYA